MVEAEEEEEVGQPTATTPRCSNTTRSTLPTSTPLTGLVPPRGTALATAAAEAAAEAETVPAPEEIAGEEAVGAVEGENGVAVEAAGEDMEELEQGKVRVRALYDYDAAQPGDLSFRVGDMIITDGGAFSGDGWVSGTCHGSTGIFPANYTEPW